MLHALLRCPPGALFFVDHRDAALFWALLGRELVGLGAALLLPDRVQVLAPHADLAPRLPEVMNDPSGVADTSGEWFEVYNASGVDVDLNGLLVTDLGTDRFTVTGSLVVAAGDYGVLGVDADTTRNGSCTPDDDCASSSLGNTDDEPILSYAAPVTDQIAWDGGATRPDPSGASMNLDPAAIDATLNDDPTRWCTAPTTTFGAGDKGTPAASHDSCS